MQAFLGTGVGTAESDCLSYNLVHRRGKWFLDGESGSGGVCAMGARGGGIQGTHHVNFGHLPVPLLHLKLRYSILQPAIVAGQLTLQHS